MGATRRRREGESRPHRLSIRLSDVELAEVAASATRDGLATGAWIADAAVQYARGVQVGPVNTSELRAVLGELNRTRTQLGRVGVLLNQAVAALNSGASVDGRLPAIAEYVRSRARRVDVEVEALTRLLP